jgi:hypothetical protein
MVEQMASQNGLGSKKLFSKMFLKLNFTFSCTFLFSQESHRALIIHSQQATPTAKNEEALIHPNQRWIKGK